MPPWSSIPAVIGVTLATAATIGVVYKIVSEGARVVGLGMDAMQIQVKNREAGEGVCK